jgi:hypothetical protein
MRNQYFKLVFREEQAFLHIYPALEGGATLSINEVTSYLNQKKYESYDIKKLNKAIVECEEETEVPLGAWDGIFVRETMDINVSLDKMKVVCRFYPPSDGGQLMDAREIVESLTFHKVKFGLNQQAVLNFLQDRHYCEDYLLAEGQQPIHGKDAKIDYFFNTSKNLKPKRNEDGSVDYKELNTISHVRKGDLLARLIPEDPGKEGQNVYGELIRPRTVRSAKLGYGKNISVNEDGTEIYSDVTGHADLINGKVFVSNVFEVPADVDNSIGNIDYEGSVLIHGNVKTGFSVNASGDVIVEGVVEGAEITAGAQIIIKHGIHGMFKGVFRAGTNLMAKYIENATVYAGGYVEAELILNSEISAGSSVHVHGKKGLINGGTIRAGVSIEADTIGTEMGTITNLEVGVEPERKARYIALSKDVEKLSHELEDTRVILQNYTGLLKKGEHLPQDKMNYVQKLAVSFKEQKEKLEPLKEEMKKIYSEMLSSNHAYVTVKRDVYPGVVIAIADLSYGVKDIRHFCKFKKQSGAIEAVSL